MIEAFCVFFNVLLYMFSIVLIILIPGLVSNPVAASLFGSTCIAAADDGPATDPLSTDKLRVAMGLARNADSSLSERLLFVGGGPVPNIIVPQ